MFSMYLIPHKQTAQARGLFVLYVYQLPLGLDYSRAGYSSLSSHCTFAFWQELSHLMNLVQAVLCVYCPGGIALNFDVAWC